GVAGAPARLRREALFGAPLRQRDDGRSGGGPLRDGGGHADPRRRVARWGGGGPLHLLGGRRCGAHRGALFGHRSAPHGPLSATAQRLARPSAAPPVSPRGSGGVPLEARLRTVSIGVSDELRTSALARTAAVPQ